MGDDAPETKLKTKLILTHAEAAAYLGLTPKSLYNRNSEQKGPRRLKRFGGLKYHKADLDAYLRHETETLEAYR